MKYHSYIKRSAAPVNNVTIPNCESSVDRVALTVQNRDLIAVITISNTPNGDGLEIDPLTSMIRDNKTAQGAVFIRSTIANSIIIVEEVFGEM